MVSLLLNGNFDALVIMVWLAVIAVVLIYGWKILIYVLSFLIAFTLFIYHWIKGDLNEFEEKLRRH